MACNCKSQKKKRLDNIGEGAGKHLSLSTGNSKKGNQKQSQNDKTLFIINTDVA